MSFSIVLNSTNNYSNTNNHEVIYSYDFTNMEEGKYEVAFSYRGKQNHLDSTDLCLVNADFGVKPTCYIAGANTTNTSSRILGTLANQYNTSTDGYMYANLNDNQPVYINSKPSNSFITITLTTTTGALFTTHGGQNPADYVIILSFKKI